MDLPPALRSKGRPSARPSGAAIRAAREAAGIEIGAAALLLNVTMKQWSVWESGRVRMPRALLDHFRLLTDTHPTLVLRRRE